MGGLEIFYVLLAIYMAVLVIGVAFSFAEVNGLSHAGWVKIIFWPITLSIFLLGVILWLLLWVPRKLFKGILLCFDDIEDFFINVFCDAIGKEKQM